MSRISTLQDIIIFLGKIKFRSVCIFCIQCFEKYFNLYPNILPINMRMLSCDIQSQIVKNMAVYKLLYH